MEKFGSGIRYKHPGSTTLHCKFPTKSSLVDIPSWGLGWVVGSRLSAQSRAFRDRETATGERVARLRTHNYSIGKTHQYVPGGHIIINLFTGHVTVLDQRAELSLPWASKKDVRTKNLLGTS
jgi:hypothetical protein